MERTIVDLLQPETLPSGTGSWHFVSIQCDCTKMLWVDCTATKLNMADVASAIRSLTSNYGNTSARDEIANRSE